MAKKKQQGMWLLLGAAGLGAFLWFRKKKDDEGKVVEAVIQNAIAEGATKAPQAAEAKLSGYFTF